MNIAPHDRDTFLVQSQSDPEDWHIVDTEEMTCSCYYFNDPTKHPITPTCRHLEDALFKLANT